MNKKTNCNEPWKYNFVFFCKQNLSKRPVWPFRTRQKYGKLVVFIVVALWEAFIVTLKEVDVFWQFLGWDLVSGFSSYYFLSPYLWKLSKLDPQDLNFWIPFLELDPPYQSRFSNCKRRRERGWLNSGPFSRWWIRRRNYIIHRRNCAAAPR